MAAREAHIEARNCVLTNRWSRWKILGNPSMGRLWTFVTCGGLLLLLSTPAQAQAAFYQFASVVIGLWVPATFAALLLLVVMIVNNKTRWLVVIPLALTALCLGPYARYSSGAPMDNTVLLNSLAMLHAAPSVFIVSAVCAWAVSILCGRASADAGDVTSSPRGTRSLWLMFNLCLAVAILVTNVLSYFFQIYPLEQLPFARGLVNYIAAYRMSLGIFVAHIIASVLLAGVLALVLGALRGDRWVHFGAMGWELLLLLNIIEVIRGGALGTLYDSTTGLAMVHIFTLPLIILAMVGLSMMLGSHLSAQVRKELADGRWSKNVSGKVS